MSSPVYWGVSCTLFPFNFQVSSGLPIVKTNYSLDDSHLWMGFCFSGLLLPCLPLWRRLLSSCLEFRVSPLSSLFSLDISVSFISTPDNQIFSVLQVLATMERLEKVNSFQEFVQIFSQFGNEMVEFAHLTGDRQNVCVYRIETFSNTCILFHLDGGMILVYLLIKFITLVLKAFHKGARIK